MSIDSQLKIIDYRTVINVVDIPISEHILTVVEKIHNMNKIPINEGYIIIKEIDTMLESNNIEYDVMNNDNYTDFINGNDLYTIIKNYDDYPIYIIKYIFTLYPHLTSRLAVEHIMCTEENNTSILETILTSYSISLCDVEDINFVCSKINVVRILETIDNMQNTQTIDDSQLIEPIEQKTIGLRNNNSNTCFCSDRKHWNKIYEHMIEYLINHDITLLSKHRNFRNSLIDLIIQTDVVDSRLLKVLNRLSISPKNWKNILSILKRAKLVSTPYDNILIDIRDRIISNDKIEHSNILKNNEISNFRNRELLASLLQRNKIYNDSLSKIIDNLYITDIYTASNVDLLHHNNIKHVVSVTRRAIFQSSNIKYYRIPIDDTKNVNIVKECSYLADEVLGYVFNNERTLVHCYKGVSRSVSFVILVLMKYGINFDDAVKLIRKKRPMSNPNPIFFNQLSKYNK